MAEQQQQQQQASTEQQAASARTVVVWRRTRQGLTLVLLGTLLIVLLWTGGMAANLLAPQPVLQLDHLQVMVVQYVAVETLAERQLGSVVLGTVGLLAWILVLIGFGLLGSTPDRSMSGSAVFALIFSIFGFLVWPLAYLGTTMFLAYCYRGATVAADNRLKLRTLGVLFLLLAAVVLTATLLVPAAPERFDETWRLNFFALDQTERAVLGLYLALWLAFSIGFLLTIHRARRVLGRERVVLAMPRQLPGGNKK